MTDPKFETRAELEAWAPQIIRQAQPASWRRLPHESAEVRNARSTAHRAWIADLGQLDADFGEAASDYAASVELPDFAAAIQSLTAERDGWNTMVRDMSLEIGRRLGERDAALARVAALEALVEEADKLLSWMNKHRDASRAVWLDQSSDWIAARALLEGSKP